MVLLAVDVPRSPVCVVLIARSAMSVPDLAYQARRPIAARATPGQYRGRRPVAHRYARSVPRVGGVGR
eukprot:2002271-Rhodomonas_salina.1